MKVFYMNDEQKPITVRIQDARFDPATFTGDIFTTLKSCEAKVFDVQIPEGCVLYMKKWPTTLMISYIDSTGLTQFDQVPPAEDEA